MEYQVSICVCKCICMQVAKANNTVFITAGMWMEVMNGTLSVGVWECINGVKSCERSVDIECMCTRVGRVKQKKTEQSGERRI